MASTGGLSQSAHRARLACSKVELPIKDLVFSLPKSFDLYVMLILSIIQIRRIIAV